LIPSEGWGAKDFCGDPTVGGQTPRFGPEVKNGRSCAKDGTPERLRCGTIQKEMS